MSALNVSGLVKGGMSALNVSVFNLCARKLKLNIAFNTRYYSRRYFLSISGPKALVGLCCPSSTGQSLDGKAWVQMCPILCKLQNPEHGQIWIGYHSLGQADVTLRHAKGKNHRKYSVRMCVAKRTHRYARHEGGKRDDFPDVRPSECRERIRGPPLICLWYWLQFEFGY